MINIYFKSECFRFVDMIFDFDSRGLIRSSYILGKRLIRLREKE